METARTSDLLTYKCVLLNNSDRTSQFLSKTENLKKATSAYTVNLFINKDFVAINCVVEHLLHFGLRRMASYVGNVAMHFQMSLKW